MSGVEGDPEGGVRHSEVCFVWDWMPFRGACQCHVSCRLSCLRLSYQPMSVWLSAYLWGGGTSSGQPAATSSIAVTAQTEQHDTYHTSKYTHKSYPHAHVRAHISPSGVIVQVCRPPHGMT